MLLVLDLVKQICLSGLKSSHSNSNTGDYGEKTCIKLKNLRLYKTAGDRAGGQAVLTLAQAMEAEQCEDEAHLVQYLSAHINRVLSTCPTTVGLIAVNSEHITWLPSSSGNPRRDMKPDVFIINRAMVEYRKVTESSREDHLQPQPSFYGKPMSMTLDTVRLTCEAKHTKKSDEFLGFGDACQYTSRLAEECINNVNWKHKSVCFGMDFNASRFILVECNASGPVRATECSWTTPGSAELLREFASQNDPLTEAFKQLCNELEVEVDFVPVQPVTTNDDRFSSILGRGGFGTAFAVRDRSDASKRYALKVVFHTNPSNKTEREFHRMSVV